MPGRPRTATAILDARGAFKNHSERKRPQEPEGKGRFPSKAPNHLTAAERKAWREVVALIPAGVLTGSDTLIVEVVARLLAEMREDFRNFPVSRLNRMTSEMNKIGLSPSSRASLEVDKKPKNEFDDL